MTRTYEYGVCVAVYGAVDVEITGTKCHDIRDWNPGQVPSGNDKCQNGAYCNSCVTYVHDGWFGAIYPDGNRIHVHGNEYIFMDDGSAIPENDRPLIRSDDGSNANVITSGAVEHRFEVSKAEDILSV